MRQSSETAERKPLASCIAAIGREHKQGVKNDNVGHFGNGEHSAGVFDGVRGVHCSRDACSEVFGTEPVNTCRTWEGYARFAVSVVCNPDTLPMRATKEVYIRAPIKPTT